MTNFSSVVNGVKTRAVSYNEGLRRYMLGVYNYMSVALALSGVIAFLTAKSGLVYLLVGSPLGWVIAFSPLIVSIVMSFKLNTAKISTVKMLYFLYAILMGMSMSTLFLMFTGVDITKTFLITACMFLSTAIYGYTTRKDLSSIGSFLIMAVFGLLIASVVNIFAHSGGLSFIISLVSVVVFTALVAYDTQNLRRLYYATCQDKDMAVKYGIFGALQLYIDFIALFIHLLQLLGTAQKRD